MLDMEFLSIDWAYWKIMDPFDPGVMRQIPTTSEWYHARRAQGSYWNKTCRAMSIDLMHCIRHVQSGRVELKRDTGGWVSLQRVAQVIEEKDYDQEQGCLAQETYLPLLEIRGGASAIEVVFLWSRPFASTLAQRSVGYRCWWNWAITIPTTLVVRQSCSQPPSPCGPCR